MSKLNKYKAIVPIAKTGTSEVVKFKHKFDISLSELAELALEHYWNDIKEYYDEVANS